MSEKVSAGVDLDALERREGMRVEGVADAVLLTTRSEADALIAELRAARAVVEKSNQLVNNVMLYMGLPASEATEYGFDELTAALAEYDRLTGERQ